MAKLQKILESMDSFKLNSEVALLENSELTDLTRAQTRKEIHENFNFIKRELIAGGLLEETHSLLADAWTQAIMEDIYLPSEDEGFGAGDAAGLAGAGAAVAGGARYVAPAVVAGVSKAANIGSDYGMKPGMVQGYRAAKQNFTGNVTNDVNAVRSAVDNTVAPIKQAVTNQVGAGAAGFAGVQGPAKPGTGAAYSIGSTLGKVKRAIIK